MGAAGQLRAVVVVVVVLLLVAADVNDAAVVTVAAAVDTVPWLEVVVGPSTGSVTAGYPG